MSYIKKQPDLKTFHHQIKINHVDLIDGHQIIRDNSLQYQLLKSVPKHLFTFYDVCAADMDEVWEKTGLYAPTKRTIFMPWGIPSVFGKSKPLWKANNSVRHKP